MAVDVECQGALEEADSWQDIETVYPFPLDLA